MTLRIRKIIGKGKIKEDSFKTDIASPRKILEIMDKTAPGLSSTAILQPESNYTISFDATKHNLLLENELRKLRKGDINFDFYTGINKKDKYEIEAINLTRPEKQERLFIEFSPRDNLEWSYIRGMFGLPSIVTEEVSDEETIETPSNYWYLLEKDTNINEVLNQQNYKIIRLNEVDIRNKIKPRFRLI